MKRLKMKMKWQKGNSNSYLPKDKDKKCSMMLKMKMKWQKGNSNSYLPKDKDKKMSYDVEDEEAKRQQQFLPPIPTLLSEKRGKAEVGLGMSDENQRRGINDGSLASRLNKRSHGLLDNLLRPPPPPAG